MSKVEPKDEEQVVYVTINNKTSGNVYHYDDNCRSISNDANLRKSTEEQEKVWRDGCSWCTEE